MFNRRSKSFGSRRYGRRPSRSFGSRSSARRLSSRRRPINRGTSFRNRGGVLR